MNDNTSAPSNPEAKSDNLTPGMKLEIHEIINTQIGKFAGNIQKISVVIGLLLGFLGYKSCGEIKDSIKTEVKSGILDSDLDELIKKDIRKTQMDGILNNLQSNIKSEDFDDEMIRDEYIMLFNEFFLNPDDKTVRIIETLNSIMQDNESSYDDFTFPTRPEGKRSLLAGINDLAKKSDDQELKFQCFRFLIYFSKDDRISEIIESFKNSYLSNSFSSSFTDDLLILLTRRVAGQNNSSDNDKQTYLDNVTRLTKIANQIVTSSARDPYFQLSGYITLLRFNEKENDPDEKYFKSLAAQLDTDPALINSLISIALTSDFIEEYEGSDFNNIFSKILVTQLLKNIKSKQPNRNITNAKTVYPIVKNKPEFASSVFDSLCNDLARTTEEKTKVLSLFNRNRNLRSTAANSYTSKFSGTLVSTGDHVDILYDNPTRKFFYYKGNNEKKIFTADSVKELSIKFLTGEKVVLE